MIAGIPRAPSPPTEAWREVSNLHHWLQRAIYLHAQERTPETQAEASRLGKAYRAAVAVARQVDAELEAQTADKRIAEEQKAPSSDIGMPMTAQPPRAALLYGAVAAVLITLGAVASWLWG